jgi:hypothetical protein
LQQTVDLVLPVIKWTTGKSDLYCQMVKINEKLHHTFSTNELEIFYPIESGPSNERYRECSLRLVKSFKRQSLQRVILTPQNIVLLADVELGFHTWKSVSAVYLDGQFEKQPGTNTVLYEAEIADLCNALQQSSATRIKFQSKINSDQLIRDISGAIASRQKPLEKLHFKWIEIQDPASLETLFSAIETHQKQFKTLQSVKIYVEGNEVDQEKFKSITRSYPGYKFYVRSYSQAQIVYQPGWIHKLRAHLENSLANLYTMF